MPIYFLAMNSDRQRATKQPFYKNIFVRHPVNPVLPLAGSKISALRQLKPCVVMGRGHSGTRLAACICHHLGVEMGANLLKVPSADPVENSFKHHQRVVATHSVNGPSSGELRPLGLNRFQRAIYGFHQRPLVKSDLWVWKFLETYLIGPYVEKTFPSARYIHIILDGRDLAFSRHLTDVPEHRLARSILRRQNALGLAHHLQAALSWKFQVESFEQFRKSVPDERILELRYEVLVSDPLMAAQELCRFLEVSLTSRARDYVENEITKDQVGAFRYQDAIKVQEVERHIGDTLRRRGYMKASGSP